MLAVALIAVIVGVVGLLLSSSSGSETKASGCAILDVSESTRDVRAAYTEEFNRFATEIGNDGTGNVCYVLAAADPLAKAVATTRSVGPAPGSVGKPDAPGEIEEAVLEETREVAGLLENPGIDERGSGLVEAANIVAKQLGPGDRIVFLSDGLQWSRSVGHLIKMDLSPEGIEALIARLRRRGLIPDLRGVEVEFPLMLFHPEGLDADAAQENRIPAFWEAWAAAAKADFTSETPSP
jgi:hypothetical protein